MFIKPTIHAGPHTHICWTPDGQPKESRKTMVLIEESQLKDLQRSHERLYLMAKALRYFALAEPPSGTSLELDYTQEHMDEIFKEAEGR